MRQKIKSTHLTRNLSLGKLNQSIITSAPIFSFLIRSAYFINITEFAKKITLTQRRIIYFVKRVNNKPWRAASSE